MRITGPGIWGPPADHDEAIAVLRRAVELGVNLIDTADSYGPDVSEELIAEALHPYPDDLLIATKGGLTPHRPGPVAARWVTGAPARGLRGLAPAPEARHDRALPAPQPRFQGALRALDRRAQGAPGRGQDPQHRRLQRVGGPARDRARDRRGGLRPEPLQPHRSLIRRTCSSAARSSGIAFLPWAPFSRRASSPSRAARSTGSPRRTMRRPGRSRSPGCLARSAVIVPIPGTSSVEHLEENLGAAELELSEEELAQLESAAD